jgi:LPXTG-motif cell wall-anchored protein
VAPTGNAPTSSSSAATAGAAAAGRATTTTRPGATGASGDVTGAAVHGENVSSTKDASQVPWTTIVGVLLIVAFAGGAGFVAWRRRAASSATGG